MCGIVGVIGPENAADILIEGLRRLEYRGYDSAGIATIVDNAIERRRAEGKLSRLEEELARNPLRGTPGIGHTRWATHGVASEANAHPHATDKVAVVHNGIIENYRLLREELSAEGYVFESETDSEVIPKLITAFLKKGLDPYQAVSTAIAKLEGAFALGILIADYPDRLFAARCGSPLAIGIGEGSHYLCSDAIGLAPFTRQICYLEEGDIAELRADSFSLYNGKSERVERPIKTLPVASTGLGKGNFRHYMEKEIHEQPVVIGETLGVYVDRVAGKISLPDLPFDLGAIERITLTACGTSYYAALVARYWLEAYARIPVDIDIASEFRYREPQLAPTHLLLTISQSGETADTLAALRYGKEQGINTLAIVNVSESSMAREADALLPTHAGPEIGVASTKAFTTQLTTLACFTLALAAAKKAIPDEEQVRLAHALLEVPARIAELLHHQESITALAPALAKVRDMLFIGRGTSYAIAYEAALKMKEISYIHAEAYAAGEMKHGPIALIDEQVPVIVIAPTDHWFEKTLSNLHEAATRGGRMILLSDQVGIGRCKDLLEAAIVLPKVHPFVAPILYAVPIQLLAYHVAVIKGTDVDQPRNLAKSVTVE